MAEELEKQEPEKQKKKEKEKKQGASGALSLPMLIGIGGGGIVLILVTVIFGYFIATKLFPTQPVVVSQNGQVTNSNDNKDNKDKKKSEDDIHSSLYMETGRITTNPKDAPSTFVVLNLSLEFVPYNKDDDKVKEMMGKEGLNMNNPIVQKMLGRIKSTVNNQIASLTLAELQAKRPELENMYKDALKTTMNEFGFKLLNVGLIEFIIQE
jgi:flagellar basal body-associated protein FliL